MSKIKIFFVAASVMFAMAFTVSCSGDNGTNGANGIDGIDGVDGKDGADGADGEDGATPLITIGANGNWFIDGVDTGKKAEGTDGASPVVTIGANGNWFIDGVDTGKKAEGTKGDTGEKGDKGDGCNVVTDPGNSAYLIMTCGTGANATSERWAKAVCGATAYDPAGNRFCDGITLYDKCGGKTYSAGNQFCDVRDNTIYKKTKIGTQTWMAENLNYDVPGATTWCYDDVPDNCDVYGRLYDWNTTMDGATSGSDKFPSGVQGICPAGWHVPSRSEWTTLLYYAGGALTAGEKLRAAKGWSQGGAVGTDNYGFSALPGGFRSRFDGFGNRGTYCDWWSATDYVRGSPSVGRWEMTYFDNEVKEFYVEKEYGFSVRCVMDD